MTDAFYPRQRRRSLLEDPDLAEAVRNARFGRPVEPIPDDGSGPSLDYASGFPTPNMRPLEAPVGRLEGVQPSASGPALDYGHAFQKPNMRPLEPRPEMPTEGPLGPALDYGRTFRARDAEQRAAARAQAAAIRQEGGMQVLGGADDFLRDTLNSLEPAIRYLEERSHLTVPRYQGADIARPETAHGAMIRDVSRYLTELTARLAAQRVGIPGAAIDAVGGFLKDPAEENFFDLVDRHREIRGPIYEFFGADRNDPAAFRRLENALLEAGLGKAADSVSRLAVVSIEALRGGKPIPALLKDSLETAAGMAVGDGIKKGIEMLRPGGQTPPPVGAPPDSTGEFP